MARVAAEATRGCRSVPMVLALGMCLLPRFGCWALIKLRRLKLSRGCLRIASRSPLTTCPPLRFDAFPFRRLSLASQAPVAKQSLSRS